MESSKAEIASVFAEQGAPIGALQHKKPTSSVNADIVGGSTSSSQAMLKQESSTASSKSTTLRTGDQVKICGYFAFHLTNKLSCKRTGLWLAGQSSAAFEDNGSSKIGVRFDKSILDDNDLGGLCEDDRGFFCSTNHFFRVDGSGEGDVDKFAINEILEMVSVLYMS